jgi:hypothetical protein
MKQHRNEQVRTVSINTELWELAASKAHSDGIKSMAAIIRLLLQSYVDGKIEVVAKTVTQ